MKYALDFGPSASGVPSLAVWRDINTGLQASGQPAMTAVVSGITDFEYSGNQVVQFRAELGDLWTAGVIDPREALPAGIGPVKIDHDYGGTDNLRVLETDTSQPVADAFIYVYDATDFAAGNIERNQYLIAWTVTKDDGRWRSPVYLDPGSYTLFITRSSAAPITQALTVS